MHFRLKNLKNSLTIGLLSLCYLFSFPVHADHIGDSLKAILNACLRGKKSQSQTAAGVPQKISRKETLGRSLESLIVALRKFELQIRTTGEATLGDYLPGDTLTMDIYMHAAREIERQGDLKIAQNLYSAVNNIYDVYRLARLQGNEGLAVHAQNIAISLRTVTEISVAGYEVTPSYFARVVDHSGKEIDASELYEKAPTPGSKISVIYFDGNQVNKVEVKTENSYSTDHQQLFAKLKLRAGRKPSIFPSDKIEAGAFLLEFDDGRKIIHESHTEIDGGVDFDFPWNLSELKGLKSITHIHTHPGYNKEHVRIPNVPSDVDVRKSSALLRSLRKRGLPNTIPLHMLILPENRDNQVAVLDWQVEERPKNVVIEGLDPRTVPKEFP